MLALTLVTGWGAGLHSAVTLPPLALGLVVTESSETDSSSILSSLFTMSSARKGFSISALLGS